MFGTVVQRIIANRKPVFVADAFCYLALFLTLSIAHANAAPVTASAEPPPGFEMLAAPHATVVTLFYGGEELGQFPAHYTANTLQFDDGASLIKLIPGLEKPDDVTKILSEPLPTHADLLCKHGETIDCGALSPAIAGVIFDENHFSAELFINAQYLAVQDNARSRYLPLPPRQLSSVYSISGAVTGTDSQTPSFAINDNSLLAFGEARLTSQSSLTNQGLRLDSSDLGGDREGLEGHVGLFRDKAMQLVSDSDIAGVSLATSMHTWRDQRQVEGNDVILYLPRRALVSIYREGRLYSTRQYDAGNQIIDTNELPQGASLITLRIQEPNGSVREETRFFAKTPEIPPPGIPSYYFQAGVIRKPPQVDSLIPGLTSDPIIRAGTSRRIADNLGLDVGVTGLKDRGILETGSFLIYEGMKLRTTGLASTRGDKGVQASYKQIMGSWNIAVDARQVWAADQVTNIIDPIPQTLKEAAGTVNYAITPNLNFGFRLNYTQQPDSPSQSSYGPTTSWTIWRVGESTLDFTADAGETNHQFTADGFLRFSMRIGNYGISGAGGYHQGGGNNGPSGNARVWHDDTTPDSSLITGATVQQDPTARSAGIDSSWRNSFGYISGLLQENHSSAGTSTNYGSNFAFNVAQVEDQIQIGGDHTDQSAVMVTVTGDADIPMKIMVNGVEHGAIPPGGRQVFYLPPYKTYAIRLVPAHSGMVDYDDTDHKVTLYPGNVTRMSWAVNTMHVVLGHIVTPDGKPLADAALQKSREPIATDDKGHLQAQLSQIKSLVFKTQDNRSCTVQLPDAKQSGNGVMIYKDPLVCQPGAATG
jgi:hypothetical protein